MTPKFFPASAAWRKWLEQHHETHRELLVGFYKTGSGHPSMTWPESVDVALCFGWIDGVRRNIDEVSYSIRFTPRKSTSTWSAVNIRKIGELTKLGLMHPAGVRAFAARREDRSKIYSFEQAIIKFNAEQENQFRGNELAWAFFSSQPASYRRAATWWVVNAKREETKEKRLATLIDDSQAGRTVKHLTRIVIKR